ncbi:MAG: YciI family protein [Gammaproteobacteria bacterium]
MQFVVTALDGTDKGALDRRLKARPDHLDGIEVLKEKGHFIAGGAILNDDGDMIGSTTYMEFDSREALDNLLNNDPYVKGEVWQKIEVRPIKLAFRD